MKPYTEDSGAIIRLKRAVLSIHGMQGRYFGNLGEMSVNNVINGHAKLTLKDLEWILFQNAQDETTDIFLDQSTFTVKRKHFVFRVPFSVAESQSLR